MSHLFLYELAFVDTFRTTMLFTLNELILAARANKSCFFLSSVFNFAVTMEKSSAKNNSIKLHLHNKLLKQCATIAKSSKRIEKKQGKYTM